MIYSQSTGIIRSLMEEKRKVLLVDDVKLFLNLEETFFKRSGCEVFTAMSGTEALRLVKKHKPDLILLDYVMSDIMGDEVCKRIKADPESKNAVVIMVTTRSSPEELQKFKDAGCDDIVTKPVNQTKLLDKAAKYLQIPNRIHFRILVKIEVEGKWEKGFFLGQSYDISNSGMMVETDDTLEIGTLVNLSFVVPGNKEPLTVKGYITRIDNMRPGGKIGLGIRFGELTPEQEQMMAFFIETKSEKK